MNLRLALLRLGPARAMRRQAVERLARATAEGFGCAAPALAGCPGREMLERYAAFSRKQAELALAAGPEAARTRLFASAARLGAEVRKMLSVRTTDEALAAARALYRAVGIDFHACGSEVEIRRCFFSRHYRPAVCGLMSAVDCGVLAGLSGGGRLEFLARLTEGAPACRARFRPPGHGR